MKLWMLSVSADMGLPKVRFFRSRDRAEAAFNEVAAGIGCSPGTGLTEEASMFALHGSTYLFACFFPPEYAWEYYTVAQVITFAYQLDQLPEDKDL